MSSDFRRNSVRPPPSPLGFNETPRSRLGANRYLAPLTAEPRPPTTPPNNRQVTVTQPDGQVRPNRAFISERRRMLRATTAPQATMATNHRRSIVVDQSMKGSFDIKIGKGDNALLNRLFTLINGSRKCAISFDEFSRCLLMFLRGDLEQKLQSCFEQYDTDHDRLITSHDLFAQLSNDRLHTGEQRALQEDFEILMQLFQRKQRISGVQQATICFDEFRQACSRAALMHLLVDLFLDAEVGADLCKYEIAASCRQSLKGYQKKKPKESLQDVVGKVIVGNRMVKKWQEVTKDKKDFRDASIKGIIGSIMKKSVKEIRNVIYNLRKKFPMSKDKIGVAVPLHVVLHTIITCMRLPMDLLTSTDILRPQDALKELLMSLGVHDWSIDRLHAFLDTLDQLIDEATAM